MNAAEWLVASHLLLVLAFVAGFLMLGQLLRQRRSPQSALAWIGFAILLPYIAVPIFFLLGWRKLRPPLRAVPRHPQGQAPPLQTLLASYGTAPIREGNGFRLCSSGETTHAALTDLALSARERIDMEIFILHPDDEGRHILGLLEKRASEGIAVRVLLDGLGSLTTWPWILRPLRRAGAEVAFFHPLLRPAWWLRANLRDHRKIVIADRQRLLAGGINIAGEYLGRSPDAERWTDLAFLAEGPIVADYQHIVEADWAYATGATPTQPTPPAAVGPSAGDARLQVLASGPDIAEDALQAALLQAIYGAQHRVWLVTPYFLPDAGLLQALATTARRGVDVRLIVPEVSNHRLADWARGPYLRELARHGGRVGLFRPGMLHAKAVLVDQELAMLGSANLDLRSLYLNFEAMLLLHGGAGVHDVEAWMQELTVHTVDSEPHPHWVREVFEGAVRLLAPLL